MSNNFNKFNLNIFDGEFYLNVLLHVVLLFTFLILFYKMYISKLQKSVINNELVSVVNNNFNFNLSTLKNEYPEYTLIIDEIEYNLIYYKKLFSTPSENTTIINNNLFSKMTHFIVLLYIILILFILVLYLTNNLTMIQLFSVIVENIITFIFVGIIEYLFFKNIAFKYIPVLPSKVYNLLIDNIKKNFSE